MHPECIHPGQWMLVSREIREHLATVFSIQKNGVSEIFNEDVVSDGRTIADLAVLSPAALTEYVGSEETFGRLWELTIAKAYSEINAPVGIIATPGSTLAPGGGVETPEQKAERIRLARVENMKKVQAANAAKRAAKKAEEAKAAEVAAGVAKA